MKWGLNVKFICYTVFIVVFISLVFSVVFMLQSRKALLHEFNTRAQSLVKNLALNIEVHLLMENKVQLTSLAQNLVQEKDVQQVTIFDQSGRPLVSVDKKITLLAWEKETVVSPVYFSPETGEGITEDMSLFFEKETVTTEDDRFQPDKVLGRVEVIFSRKGIMKTLDRMRWWIIIAATAAAFIGGIAALYFSHTLIMPMQRLARATYSIARGNWQERLDIVRTDELGQLTESFNIMAESLIIKKQQLENTYRELSQKEKMAEIGKFSMIIAHELKNPLGIIKGSVDILQKQTTEARIRETMIGYIQEEVKRLNKLIEDFLAFARPTPPQKAISDLNSVIKKVSEHFMVPEELAKQISLAIDLGSLPPIALDENQIYQVLLNLINNAVQAIEHEGIIRIQTKGLDGWVRVRVSNSGSKIADEIKEKIFEPFFTTKAKGTGLGLAIVKKFVENHNGRIELSDLPDDDTVFVIFLPVEDS